MGEEGEAISPYASASNHAYNDPGEDLPGTAADQLSTLTSQHSGGDGNRAPSSVGSQAISADSGCARSTNSSTYEYSQESFETFKDKVVQLCFEIGWGEPSQVERMRGGSFNRVIGLTFSTRQPKDYILRIPRFGCESDSSEDIKDQVALLHYLSQFLPVASVAAFDSTRGNALGSSYVLQQRLPGTALSKILYQASPKEQLELATLVANLTIKMETLKLDDLGRLTAHDGFPPSKHDYLSDEKAIKVTGLRRYPYLSGSDMPTLGNADFAASLRTLLQERKRCFLETESTWMIEKIEKLENIVNQMEEVGFFRNSDKECVIWHSDFAPRNIMVGRESQVVLPVMAPNMNIDKKKSTTSQSSTKCHHEVRVTGGGSTQDDITHTINVEHDRGSSTSCQHRVQVTIEDSCGTSFVHTLQVRTPTPEHILLQSLPGTHENAISGIDAADLSTLVEPKVDKTWTVTGVIDWDGIVSVPLVLSRSAPVWLWCNEDERSSDWAGKFEQPPARLLTQNELLIKAHFDQIMAKHSPSYMDDAYGRGPWIRRLASFALRGFGEFGSFERCDFLVKEWRVYYNSIAGHPMDESSDGDSDEELEDAEEVDIVSELADSDSGEGAEDGGDCDALSEATLGQIE